MYICRCDPFASFTFGGINEFYAIICFNIYQIPIRKPMPSTPGSEVT